MIVTGKAAACIAITIAKRVLAGKLRQQIGQTLPQRFDIAGGVVPLHRHADERPFLPDCQRHFHFVLGVKLIF